MYYLDISGMPCHLFSEHDQADNTGIRVSLRLRFRLGYINPPGLLDISGMLYDYLQEYDRLDMIDIWMTSLDLQSCDLDISGMFAHR